MDYMLLLKVVLVAAAVFLWAITFATAHDMHKSDAAGNAIAGAFASLEGIGLWILLFILLAIAAGQGKMPAWSAVAGFILVPASGFAAVTAIEFMVRNGHLRSPLLMLVLAPGLMLAYCAWCFFPAFRSAVAPAPAGIAVWGAILLLLPLPWAARAAANCERERELAAIPKRTPEEIAEAKLQKETQDRQQRADAFHALTPDSSLSQWWEYAGKEGEFRSQALEGARHVKSRQQDVVQMLAQGNHTLFLAIPRLDLQATPELEQAVRAFLLDQVRNLMPYDPSRSITTRIVTEWYAQYFPTIQWLIDNHRSCDAELDALAEAVRKYPDTPEREAFLAKLQSFHVRANNS